MDLTLREQTSLDSVNSASWNALDHGPSPFLEWGFLRALERSGSTGAQSGWEPHYLLVYGTLADAQDASPDRGGADRTPSGVTGGRAATTLLGAVPAYVKDHSYGEYIFDFHWARAAAQGRIPYYPKLVIAAPATPATGRRILLHPGLDADGREAVAAKLIEGVRALADDRRCSSIHWLFCTDDEQRLLARHGFAHRASFQFHWQNREYGCFDDFLATLTSRKRKQIRKERRRALEAVDSAEFVTGPEMTREQLDNLDRFYRRTTNLYGGRAYLRPGFFQALLELAPERVRFFEARQGGQAIGGALFFETTQGLYGRYWGCEREVEFLHFEASYYAGIQRCIEQGLPLFEAGAQGEHKLLRGFMPRMCHSAHWMRHPGLDRGVREFLCEEEKAVEQHIRYLGEYGPYKAGEGLAEVGGEE